MSRGHGSINLISDAKQINGMSFDYIVVGGGTCGCPLAATLSERFTVLLVERGGSPFEDPNLKRKENYTLPFTQVNEFTSTVQKFVSEEGVDNYRGRVLGGSSAINGGAYCRTTEEHIISSGWDRKLVMEAYEWVESKIVFEPKELTPLQSCAKDIFTGAGILPFHGYTLDHVEGTRLIGTTYDENDNRYCSAHLLYAGEPTRLTVLLNATVDTIIFSPGTARARGIRFIESYGNVDTCYEAYLNEPQNSEASGDIVLCAGAIGSPQILMLSGIGRAEHLRKFDIIPLINSPQVGQGISDSPSIGFVMEVNDRVAAWASEQSQVIGITNKSQCLIQINGGKRRILQGKLPYPRTSGVLELKCRDPRQNPSVKYNYLVDEKDLDDCVEMVHELKKVAKSMDSVLGTKYSEMVDKIILDRVHDRGKQGMSKQEEMKHFCKSHQTSFLHSHGGCHFGSVVDGDYKVYGVIGLRVLDASVLDDQMVTSPMGTLLMLGRYQGVKILRERDMLSSAEQELLRL